VQSQPARIITPCQKKKGTGESPTRAFQAPLTMSSYQDENNKKKLVAQVFSSF
jgi:hypothetical protein